MKNVIGIDIGGTKITGIVYDGKKIVDELTIATPATFPEFQRNLLKLTDFLSAQRKISAIGIASAGEVNPQTGRLIFTRNARFKADFNLVKLFKTRFRQPVKIDNDANAFTRAEMLLGQGKKFDNFLGMILGTGMGGGIVISRKIYRGENYAAAGFGHIVFGEGFIEQHYQKARDKRDYKAAGKIIGRGLASLVNLFAPDAIIIGGGFGHNEAKKYLPYAMAEMKKNLLVSPAASKILITKLKHAGALGAALLVK